MNCKWLLQEDLFGEGIDLLAKEIENQGMEAKIAKYHPMRSGGDWKSLYNRDDCVVFYGTINFANQIRNESNWIVFGEPTNYLFSEYCHRFGSNLLNENYTMLPLGDLKRLWHRIERDFGVEGCVFIRPNSNEKPFRGQVVSDPDVFLQHATRYGYGMSELIVVSDYNMTITNEWRIVMRGTVPVTGSRYGHVIDPNVPQNVLDYASEVATEIVWRPDRVWVMDIALNCWDYGNLCVVEINPVSVSGLYACDKSAFVKAVSEEAVNEWNWRKWASGN